MTQRPGIEPCSHMTVSDLNPGIMPQVSKLRSLGYVYSQDDLLEVTLINVSTT